MTKPAKTRLVTLLILAAAGTFVIARQAGWELDYSSAPTALGSTFSRESDPRNTIYRMLDAARDGDVEAYLSCYMGELADRLRQSRDETTTQDFAGYLTERNQAIKGVAVSEPESVSAEEVRVRVEYVYVDRNEVQQLYLKKADGAWKISRLDAAAHVETPVPYGTPVD